MPIYEYTCNACKEVFALLQGIEESAHTKCPKCGSREVRKLLSSFSCSLPSDSGSPSGGSFSGSGFSGGG